MGKSTIFSDAYTLGDHFDLGNLNVTDGAIFEGFRSDVKSTLLVLLNSPQKEELQSMLGAKFAKTLFEEDGSVFLMFKSSALEFDLAINTKVIPSDILAQYEMGEGNRISTAVIVVDTATSKIVHLGLFTLPVDTTVELTKVIDYQRGYTDDEITLANNNVMSKYTVDQMLVKSGIYADPRRYLIGK